MPVVENKRFWSFLSTGSGSTNALVCQGMNRELTAYVETGPGATCTVQIESARTSTSPGANIGSTTISTGATHVLQFTGPFLSVWPRVTDMSSNGSSDANVFVRVEIVGN